MPAANPPPTLPKFAIVTLPRSGSYNLVSLLNSAPDIVCHGEIFKRDTVELGPPFLGKLGVSNSDIGARDANPMQFLTRVRNLNGRKIFGFKMFPEHASRLKPLANQVLRNPNWRKIFLTRNPIASYASLLRARQTDIWTLKAAAANAPPRERLDARVAFAADSFDEHLQLCRWFDEQIRAYAVIDGNRCLTLDYEQVTDRSGLAGALDFVGSAAAAATLRSDFEKQFAGRVGDGFSNWGALVAHARAQGLHAALDILG